VKAILLLALLAVLGVAAGCGTTKKTVVTSTPGAKVANGHVGSTSVAGTGDHARGRDYSVAQVVTAFKRHGIWLRMSDEGCSAGYVCLDDGGENVFAYVFVGPKSGMLVTVGSDGQTDRGNLLVVWPRSYGKRVGAAIRTLR